MITENKFSKYLIYAVGEIVLVVIGILIAISLNNSNQTQIRNKNSDEKLIKLRQLIYQDSLNIAQTINYSKSQIAKIQVGIDLLDEDLSEENYHIIIKNLVIGSGPRTIPLDRTIYEEMLNSGEFSNIRDTDLKQKIASYYDQYEHFDWIIKNYIQDSELPKLSAILYQEDIIRKRHIEEIVREQNSYKGFIHFRKAINESKNYGRFENYAYSSKKLHELIILYHEILRRNFITGLTINPKITKG